jgi:3-hydroxyisobutyrate dehydrogenase-like beta-hydroxyacid dehydrogenase
MKVGFLGLGAMGRRMAARLVDAGHDVHVWNRSPEPLQALVQQGAHSAENPGVVFDADAVITMLADDDAVRATILDRGLLHVTTKKLVHVIMSTLYLAIWGVLG